MRHLNPAVPCTQLCGEQNGPGGNAPRGGKGWLAGPGIPPMPSMQDQGWDARCSGHDLAGPPLASTLVQSAHLSACTWELEIVHWLAEEEPKLSEVV